MAANDSYRLGLILVTASAIAWSTTGFFTRLIHLDAATMLVWRGLFGAAAMLAFIAGAPEQRGALPPLRGSALPAGCWRWSPVPAWCASSARLA